MSSTTLSTLHVLPKVWLTPEETLAWLASATTWFWDPKVSFTLPIHHVFGNASSARNECADIAASFGTNGFISECNVPSFWSTTQFFCAAFL